MNKYSYLMCPPEYYDVDYVINPWMEGNIHQSDHNLAKKQWNNLYKEIQKHAEVKLIDPIKSLPDMVFTANAGIVKNKKATVSKFTFPQRQGEEVYFKSWFEKNGYSSLTLDDVNKQEGAGDSLFQRGRSEFLWGGYGFRSKKDSYQQVSTY